MFDHDRKHIYRFTTLAHILNSNKITEKVVKIGSWKVLI